MERKQTTNFWVFINFWSKEIPWTAAHFPLPSLQVNTGPQYESSQCCSSPSWAGCSVWAEHPDNSVSLSSVLSVLSGVGILAKRGDGKRTKQLKDNLKTRYNENYHEFTIHTKRHCYTNKMQMQQCVRAIPIQASANVSDSMYMMTKCKYTYYPGNFQEFHDSNINISLMRRSFWCYF